MLKHTQAEAAGEADRGVGTAIVNENADVYELRQFGNRSLEGFFRVVSRHYDRYALAVDHVHSSLYVHAC